MFRCHAAGPEADRHLVQNNVRVFYSAPSATYSPHFADPKSSTTRCPTALKGFLIEWGSRPSRDCLRKGGFCECGVYFGSIHSHQATRIGCLHTLQCGSKLEHSAEYCLWQYRHAAAMDINPKSPCAACRAPQQALRTLLHLQYQLPLLRTQRITLHVNNRSIAVGNSLCVLPPSLSPCSLGLLKMSVGSQTPWSSPETHDERVDRGVRVVLTLVERNGSATAAYTNVKMVVGARLVVINRRNIRRALPRGLIRKQGEHKRALEIVVAVITVVNLKGRERRC